VSGKALFYTFSGFTGWDMIYYLAPERLQARAIAQALLRGIYKGLDVDGTPLTIVMPHGQWRVKTEHGHVELVAGDAGAAGLP